MLLEGVNLMAVGMTAVFSFLTLLVVVLQLSARLFRSFGHTWPDPEIASTLSPAEATVRRDSEVALVIAAVKDYRRRLK